MLECLVGYVDEEVMDTASTGNIWMAYVGVLWELPDNLMSGG
jgi:hypothetical protein